MRMFTAGEFFLLGTSPSSMSRQPNVAGVRAGARRGFDEVDCGSDGSGGESPSPKRASASKGESSNSIQVCTVRACMRVRIS
jgi:hypothetical protein